MYRVEAEIAVVVVVRRKERRPSAAPSALAVPAGRDGLDGGRGHRLAVVVSRFGLGLEAGLGTGGRGVAGVGGRLGWRSGVVGRRGV